MNNYQLLALFKKMYQPSGMDHKVVLFPDGVMANICSFCDRYSIRSNHKDILKSINKIGHTRANIELNTFSCGDPRGLSRFEIIFAFRIWWNSISVKWEPRLSDYWLESYWSNIKWSDTPYFDRPD